jgi:hypothetical protein
MSRFGSPETIGKAFVAAYFTTTIYNFDNIPKFYAPNAVIRRNTSNFQFTPELSPANLGILTPVNSTLIVVRYTSIPTADSILVTVSGVIDTPLNKTGFAQNFVLIERDDKLWIQADFLLVADEHFFAQADGDTFLTIDDNPPSEPRPKGKLEPPPEEEEPSSQICVNPDE